MLINKEMYNLLLQINDLIKELDTLKKEEISSKRSVFIKNNREVIAQLVQANLIYEDNNQIIIKGPGYMAIEAYKENIANQKLQKKILIVASLTLVATIFTIIITILIAIFFK